MGRVGEGKGKALLKKEHQGPETGTMPKNDGPREVRFGWGRPEGGPVTAGGSGLTGKRVARKARKKAGGEVKKKKQQPGQPIKQW